MSNEFDIDAATDTAIDDIAREMTSVPVDAGLARRVSARIDADGERRTWPWMWLLAPAAAACVLALAVFVARENPEPAPAQTVQTNPEAGREIATAPQAKAGPAVTALKGAAPGTAPRTASAALGKPDGHAALQQLGDWSRALLEKCFFAVLADSDDQGRLVDGWSEQD